MKYNKYVLYKKSVMQKKRNMNGTFAAGGCGAKKSRNREVFMNENRKGVYPTMITPFTKEGGVDFKGVEALTEWYWKKGCDGIFAVCQSSEIFYLTLNERVEIAKTVVDTARKLAEKDKSREPMTIVVSGHISSSFDDQVAELNAMAATGADALILITNRMDTENTSEQKWIEDLRRLLAALPSDIQLGLYECPKPYKRLLSEKMLLACVETGRFSFIKDTCCDISVIRSRCKLLDGSKVMLFNANAQTLMQSLECGASGYCGVMANFHPELYKWLIENYKSSALAEQVQAFLGLAAFTETLAYPATAKYYLKTYEGIDIEPYSRSVDCRLVTDYQKNCLAQMKLLADETARRISAARACSAADESENPQKPGAVFRQVMIKERDAITKMIEDERGQYYEVLKLFNACRGRIVFMGVGKSGHIGKKLAATFASLGIPSIFVHSTEAMHGDLGMITKDDIAVLISNSGATQEVVQNVGPLKRNGVVTVAFTSHSGSALAEQCDYSIIYPALPEADALNLAPTVSSTLTLVLGDAMACALSAKKGFSRREFYKYHPNGALGKMLAEEEK